MAMKQKFRKLDVWQKAMSFVENIYEVTGEFPQKEVYGLTSQLRRAALSIPLNIAEGSGASSDQDFSRFLSISLRSTYEVMCGIEIAVRLKYCAEQNKTQLLSSCEELSAMITGLKKKLLSAKYIR